MSSELALLARARCALENVARQPVLETPSKEVHPGVDGFFEIAGTRFAVEVKANSRSAGVAQGIAQLISYREQVPDAPLLLVVPFMGEAGQELCNRANVNWLDAAGNAEIHGTTLHVVVRGRKADRDEVGASSDQSLNPFGRKAAGLVHALLVDPHRRWTRRELHEETDLDLGYVSKIVTALVRSGLTREALIMKTRTLEVIDPTRLLDTWSERYIRPHVAFHGLVAARDGFAATEKLRAILSEADVRFALTGLSAAAHYTNFGSFRRVEAYVSGWLPQQVLRQLTVDGDTRGRNILLYADEKNSRIGVETANGMNFASPIVTYLDLAGAPERAEEARDEMRTYLMKSWA